MANANKKGKRGERMACKFLEALGFSARRSQQYSGVRTDDTSADILTDLDDLIRFEVKYGYDTELHHKMMQEWVDTARSETPEGKDWVILYKKTGARSWSAIFEYEGMICQTVDIENLIKQISEN